MKVVIYTDEKNVHLINDLLTSSIPYEHNILFSENKNDIKEDKIIEIILEYNEYIFLQDFSSSVPKKFKN
jgi:hypothetical protein